MSSKLTIIDLILQKKTHKLAFFNSFRVNNLGPIKYKTARPKARSVYKLIQRVVYTSRKLRYRKKNRSLRMLARIWFSTNAVFCFKHLHIAPKIFASVVISTFPYRYFNILLKDTFFWRTLLNEFFAWYK